MVAYEFMRVEQLAGFGMLHEADRTGSSVFADREAEKKA